MADKFPTEMRDFEYGEYVATEDEANEVVKLGEDLKAITDAISETFNNIISLNNNIKEDSEKKLNELKTQTKEATNHIQTLFAQWEEL